MPILYSPLCYNSCCYFCYTSLSEEAPSCVGWQALAGDWGDWTIECVLELHMGGIYCCLHLCSLHKVLFTEQPETYYKWDNWPPESDRK